MDVTVTTVEVSIQTQVSLISGERQRLESNQSLCDSQVPAVSFPMHAVTLEKPEKLRFSEDRVAVTSERFLASFKLIFFPIILGLQRESLGIILQVRAGGVIKVTCPKGSTMLNQAAIM